MKETITVTIDEELLAEVRTKSSKFNMPIGEVLGLCVHLEILDVRPQPVPEEYQEDEHVEELDEDGMEAYYREVKAKPTAELTDDDLDLLRAERMIKKYWIARR